MKANSILDTIGHTPHVRINRLFGSAEVWIKSERGNPGGSIKDRIALSMVADAEKRGLLIDLNAIPALSGIRLMGDHIVIGALILQAVLSWVNSNSPLMPVVLTIGE